MFRLKGDICRQLSNHYKLSFKQKYKKEIKERILFFINNYENSLNTLSFTERLAYLKSKINIKNNEIIGIEKDLINEELLNLFNINWYEKKEKTWYTKKEENEILNVFVSNICYETYKEVLENEINEEFLLNFNKDNTEIYNPLYQIEKYKENYNKKRNIECKSEKARILNRRTTKTREQNIDTEPLEIGYQDITDYILFYIETKCLKKIENL